MAYLARRGKFFILARSNVVSTPKKRGASDVLDENWSSAIQEQFQKIYSQSSGGSNGSTASHDLRDLFEERLRRPMHGLSRSRRSVPGQLPSLGRDFHFELDAELIVYGTTEPNAKVTLQGEPVQLRSDGTFTVRFALPDSRQIIPAVAASPDGVEERTIVLAVERNARRAGADDPRRQRAPIRLAQAGFPSPSVRGLTPRGPSGELGSERSRAASFVGERSSRLQAKP